MSKTRFDALRCLFYALPPIAMDIAVRIAYLIQEFYGQSHDDDDGQKIPLDISTKALILFALRLPHAPQLSPIVSEIFEDHRYGCPFDYILRMNEKQTNSYPSSQDYY
jgi:hypothetical protein